MSRPGENDPDKIFAPWGVAVVAALNDYQVHGLGHPFTCGRGQSGEHASGISLVATTAGWRCPVGSCVYVQRWAWKFMADKTMGEAVIGHDN